MNQLRYANRRTRVTRAAMVAWRTAAASLLLPLTPPHRLIAQTPGDRVARAVDESVIRAHLGFLSDDLLEGRAPATRGGDLAAKYIAVQFRRLGLEPAGGRGTYYQPVPLVSRRVTEMDLRLLGDSEQTLRPAEDYVLWSEGRDTASIVAGTSIFVGYGIVAPVYGWDDYGRTDVSGRLVVALAGDPDSTRFDRHTGMTYGTWRYKVDEAARHGAAGILLIHTPLTVTYPWRTNLAFIRELTALDRPPNSLRFEGWLTESAARSLLASERLDLDTLVVLASRRGFRPIALRARFTARVRTSARHWATQNVVARLPARGPLARQAVVIGAHYDHLGIGQPVAGDSIYNGAEDNASGTAGVLAAAEAFARSGVHPSRSVYFVAFGAEELGLLGSQALIARPPAAAPRLVAAMNLDVANLWGRTRDIGTVGPEHSTLGAVLRTAAAAESLKVSIDPDDLRRGRFYGSDQLSFMLAGIPAIRLLNGLDYEGRPPDWGHEQKEIMWSTRIHTPGDDVKLWYTSDGTAQEVRVLVRMALAVADAPEPPQWAAASPFRGLQARDGGRHTTW